MSFLKNLKPHKVVVDAFNYKFCLAGRPKAGKTSLLYGIVKEKFNGDLSKLLLIAFEKGYNALDGIYAKDINTWKEFQELVDELIEYKDEIPFRILGFDTVDIMAKLATEYIIKQQARKDGKKYETIADIPYGKGYDLLESEMAKQITKLDKAGFSLFFITHDKDKQFETREGLKYDKTTLSLSGRVRDLILNMVDFIVFIEIGKEREGTALVDKRWIYFRGDSSLEAGSRFKHVPERIEYSYKGFLQAIEDAIAKEYNNDTNAMQKAMEEQNKRREEEAKKFIEQEKNKMTAEEMIQEITKLVTPLDDQTKIKIAKKFKEILGDANYMNATDEEALAEALEFVKSVIAE